MIVILKPPKKITINFYEGWTSDIWTLDVPAQKTLLVHNGADVIQSPTQPDPHRRLR